MVETGDTQTAMLELDQEALNDKRRKPAPGTRGRRARLRWTWCAGATPGRAADRAAGRTSMSPALRRVVRGARPASPPGSTRARLPSIPDPVETGLLGEDRGAARARSRGSGCVALEKWHQQIQARLSAYAFPEALFKPGVRASPRRSRTSGASCSSSPASGRQPSAPAAWRTSSASGRPSAATDYQPHVGLPRGSLGRGAAGDARLRRER